MKNIIFTGGGSGGHVIPGATLIKKLKTNPQNRLFYIGDRNGIEHEIISTLDIPFYSIKTGKLRRYLSFQNVLDIFKIGIGTLQSFWHMLKFSKKNTLIFSTGGFVSVPVVVAAKITGKKIFIHEQTTRVGLANKICSKLADKVFVSFEESLPFFPKDKVEWSGYPLRDAIYSQTTENISISGISINEIRKPILFITGGGNGSKLLNDLVKESLDKLSSKYFIIHQVGRAFIEEYSKLRSDDYIPLGFVGEEMIDLYKLSSIIFSRAGAGTVCELIALKKKSVFIPLKIAQKNEQFHNAMAAKEACGSIVLEEHDIKNTDIIALLEKVYLDDSTIDSRDKFPNGTQNLILNIDKCF